METTAFTYTTYIAAAPERVWDALTSARLTPRYWSGCSLESDWGVGSPTVLTRDGVVRSSGQVLECTPTVRLAYSFTIRYVPEYEAEGATQVAFELERLGDQTRLTLRHSGFGAGSKTLPVISESWPIILSSLKSLLETGTALGDIRRAGGRFVAEQAAAA